MKEYFMQNSIAWWGGGRPTTHPLSSQAACLNHLFPIRDDRKTILAITKSIDPLVVDVLPIVTDAAPHGYVAFEAVSDVDHLNEASSTRGSNCTSLDALVVGKHDDGKVMLLPIEWKYTEYYGNDNKAKGDKGKTRKGRYETLIDDSTQLAAVDHEVYYFEPFYQLMRQTLWAEQMVAHKATESIKADGFIHVHVIPPENRNLLKRDYGKTGGQKNMEGTWRSCLSDSDKYRIVAPEKLLEPIDRKKYAELLGYLAERYWNPLT